MSFGELIAQADRAVQRVLGGELMTYQSDSDGPVEVTGVFDEQYVLAKGSANAGVEALGPAAFFRVGDLPGDIDEDDEPTLTIRGVDYHVIERRPDGMGGIVLALRRVA